jgi:multidrug efflux pump subunit AcrB
MKRKRNIVEAAMKYWQIVAVFVVAMMVMGVFGLKNMPRNEFPEFTIRQGVIVGVYPGATSLEVEEQLTKKVENYLFGFTEVNKAKTYSYSKEGMMYVIVELNDNVNNADKFWSKLRLGLDELKMQLPGGVLALIGSNDFGDTSAFLITMSSDEKDYRELEEIMKDLEADIRKINSVAKIKRYGTQKENIYVYVNQEKLNEYSIKPATILAMFKIQEALNYAGDVDNGELVLPVHIPPHFNSERELEQQIIYSDPQGNIIRLKDVARIERKYETPSNYIRNNGNNSLLLSLEMQPGNNIVQFGKEVEKVLEDFELRTADDVEINIISNLPEVVESSISHFMKEFLIAVIAVIIVTMILLPFRISSVAAVTIPISILITLGIMQMVGIQLDIVTLAGLIVVLGMVVDNAIVVIDNHIEKLDHGETPWNAAWKAATELFIPVLSATTAICAAFFPVMIVVTGMFREFVGNLPIVIGIALGISMLVSTLLVPFISYVFIKRGLNHTATETKSNGFLQKVQSVYDAGLEKTFAYPKTTILLGILTVVVSVGIFLLTDQKLFPSMDRKQFAVEIYLPEGSALNQTEKIVDSLEIALLQDDRITNVASFVGNGSPRFHTLYAPHMPAKNYGQILVNTISNEATLKILDEFSEEYEDAFVNANIKWKQIAFEKFTAPLEIRISGDNIYDIKQTAEEVAEILGSHEKTTWVRTDWAEMRKGVSLELDENKSNQLGYAKTLIASSLLIGLEGLPITTIWEGDYPIEVILSKEEYLKDEISDLENLQIISPITMESLPLRAVAKIKPELTEGNIVRRNGVRTITVLSDVKRNTNYSNTLNDLRPQIDNLVLPTGVTIEYGGEQGENAEVYGPMVKSLLISVVLIFFILILQFKTVRRTLLVMSTMLFSVIGAVLGLKIIGYPFSATAFLGFIGLIGITVRSGIILIDYAMQLVTKEGYTYKEAAIAAGKRRMRPIFLTAMAAAVGVIPMILSDSPLWGPLGTVICFGLISGMILTLFVLPVLFWKTTAKESYTDAHPTEEIPVKI